MNFLKIGLKVAEWATPHVQELHAAKHFSRTEGSRHAKVGNWAEAEKHLRRGLEEESYADKHRLQMMLDLAMAQRQQAKLAEAGQTGQDAVVLARQMKTREGNIDALVSFSETQMAFGDAPGAIETLRQADTFSGNATQEDIARRSVVLRKQAAALLAGGQHEESRRTLELALTFAQKAHGETHIETAHTLTEVGTQLRESGDQEMSQTVLRRALEIYRKNRGQPCPQEGEALRNLAMSLEASGDMRGAMGVYEQMLTSRERQIGGNREETAEVGAHLALLYLQDGRLGNARELLVHAVGVLERRGGEKYLLALEALAVSEELSGRDVEASRLRQKLARLQPAPAPVQA